MGLPSRSLSGCCSAKDVLLTSRPQGSSVRRDWDASLAATMPRGRQGPAGRSTTDAPRDERLMRERWNDFWPATDLSLPWTKAVRTQ
jgi:hypothetical protein